MSALSITDFAIWATTTSLLIILQFLDFGIGNSAMGKITEALAHNDHARATQLVRHAYLVLGSIAVVVLTVDCLLYVSGMFELLALRSGSFLASHIDLVATFVVCYAFVIPATFVQRLLFAQQQAGSATILQLVFSLTYFGFSALVAWRAPDLAVFVLGYVLLMVLVYGGFSLYHLRAHYPDVQLHGGIDHELTVSLLKGAGLFFLLQITVAIVYNSDNIILTTVVNPDEVAIYATTWRMFSLVVMVNSLILGPLWPAVADAKAKGDLVWLRTAYLGNLRRSMIVSILLATILALLGNLILNVWTGGKIQAPIELLCLLAIWVILEGYGQCMAMLLNGLHILHLQLAVASMMLTLGTGLKLYLAGKIGIYGPIMGTIIAFALIVGITETLFIDRLLKRKS
jgi:O-antigen/teichoic acid export membrane protein